MKIQRMLVALTVINLLLLAFVVNRAGSTAQQDVTPIVRTRAFEVVDARGRIRARLNVAEDGEVIFRLTDQQGTIRVKLGADDKGSGLMLANDATEPGVHILAKPTGSSLKLVNKDGRERLITP